LVLFNLATGAKEGKETKQHAFAREHLKADTGIDEDGEVRSLIRDYDRSIGEESSEQKEHNENY
jgi:hypothetical protein